MTERQRHTSSVSQIQKCHSTSIPNVTDARRLNLIKEDASKQRYSTSQSLLHTHTTTLDYSNKLWQSIVILKWTKRKLKVRRLVFRSAHVYKDRFVSAFLFRSHTGIQYLVVFVGMLQMASKIFSYCCWACISRVSDERNIYFYTLLLDFITVHYYTI